MKQQEQIMVDWTELERDLKQCQSMISSMCAEGRPPKMSIPARPDYDEDIFICETINKTLAILSERQKMLAKLEAAQRENEHLRCSLRYYATGQHFMRGNNDAWDTVSGEPPNFWCDEAGTATVEDGSFAAHSLRNNIEWSAEDALPIEGEKPYLSLAAFDKETA